MFLQSPPFKRQKEEVEYILVAAGLGGMISRIVTAYMVQGLLEVVKAVVVIRSAGEVNFQSLTIICHSDFRNRFCEFFLVWVICIYVLFLLIDYVLCVLMTVNWYWSLRGPCQVRLWEGCHGAYSAWRIICIILLTDIGVFQVWVGFIFCITWLLHDITLRGS